MYKEAVHIIFQIISYDNKKDCIFIKLPEMLEGLYMYKTPGKVNRTVCL